MPVQTETALKIYINIENLKPETFYKFKLKESLSYSCGENSRQKNISENTFNPPVADAPLYDNFPLIQTNLEGSFKRIIIPSKLKLEEIANKTLLLCEAPSAEIEKTWNNKNSPSKNSVEKNPPVCIAAAEIPPLLNK